MKLGAWTIYLKGFWLAVIGVAVPYIPTAKERKKGKFWRLARLPLMTIAISFLTLIFTIWRQLYVVPESEVRITTEVTLGMLSFLLVNGLFMSGRIYAAWVDREGSKS